MKYYKISEEELKALLSDSAQLGILNYSGVDNWEWYGEGTEDFIADSLEISTEEVKEQELEIDDVVNKWLKDYEIIEEA